MPESKSIGKALKKIRESKQLSIEEASETTRIPKNYILAIEEDRPQEISSDFYARSFTRTYAKFLNAMEDKDVKAYFHSEQPGAGSAPEASAKPEKTGKNLFITHKKRLAQGALIIFCFWAFMLAVGQFKKFIDNVSAKRKAVVSEAKAQDPETQEKKPSVNETGEGFSLEIEAKYNTWVQLMSDGELFFRGTLKKGTSDVWQAKKEISLNLGNAGGVSLKLDGKDMGVPGKKGEKKDIIVTKEGIKQAN